MIGKWLAIAFAALSWIGAAEAKPLRVVATFTVIADMATQIGGPDVEVRSLVGPNGDVHAYEPTPDDARALAEADLVLVNGLHLEGWIDRLVTVSGYKRKIVVASEGIKLRSFAGEAGSGAPVVDPHAWNNAANGAIYAANIARALAAADAEHAAGYRDRAERYAGELRELDAWARRVISAIPTAKRKIITSHDALGYLADAYAIEVHAPIGFSTTSEASAGEIAALIQQIRREHIKAVFIENASDPRLVKQIARETGAKLGGTLYPEALSEPGGPAPTYVQMFRHNIETIRVGMQQN